MRNRMTAWGVGPKIAFISLFYCPAVIFLHILMPGQFVVTRGHSVVFFFPGIGLILSGIYLWVSGARIIDKAFDSGVLLTRGVYAFVRHPMYSGFIVFIAPGIAICFRSWLLLTPSILAYVVFRILIREEDEYLEGRFGQAFLDYRSRVNAIIPFIRIQGDKRAAASTSG
jgi:protein-S-isoprenylcysteine O-methyltransferase Ste14